MRTQEQEHSGADGSSYRGGGGLLPRQRLLGRLVLAAALIQGPLAAQTNSVKAAPSKRCLLIVDTSRSMQRRTEATLKVVQDLVLSGLGGQFRRGDTFGLWTFNEALYAGRFPLQSWSPEGSRETAARMVAFLKAQKCDKAPSFDKVLPALAYVVEHSDRLTVIFVSSGEEVLRGTPFDKPINDYYQRLHDQQQKAHMPFVTVLSARGGRLVDYTLNTPPWPLQLPSPPAEAQAAETLQQRLQEALQKGQTTSAPPLIVSGKKPQPESVPAPKPEAPGLVATSSVTNKPAGRLPPSRPAQMAKTDAALAAPAMPATQLATKPTAAPIPAVEPSVEAVKAPQAKPLEPVLTKSNMAPAAPVLPPKPQATAAAQPKPALPAALKQPAPPATPASPQAVVNATSNVVSTAPAPTRPSPVAPRPSASPTPLAQAATVVPGGKLGLALWLGALVVALVAALFALLWLRRSPPGPQGSLITRSYDRGRKR